MNNQQIRQLIKRKHLFLWQVAEEIGICEMTLIRWLRTDLADDKKNKILNAVKSLVQKSNNRG